MLLDELLEPVPVLLDELLEPVSELLDELDELDELLDSARYVPAPRRGRGRGRGLAGYVPR